MDYKKTCKILIILVLILLIFIAYLIKNNIKKTSSSAEQIHESDIRIEFELQSEAVAYINESNALDSEISDSFYGRYYIGGDICIDYYSKEKGNTSITIKTDVPVIAIETASEYDYYWIPAMNAKKGDSYKFKSTAYFLFKDGTIGKISTDDIKQGNYTITKLEQYNNIISIFSCNLPEFSGGDVMLYAMDQNTNIYEIDIVASGN